MSTIEFFTQPFLGQSNEEVIDKIFESLVSLEPISPFDTRLVAFVNQFSKKLLLRKDIRKYPELAVLATFFKKKNVELQQRLYMHSDGGSINLARGSVLHIAPANVDSIFLYSSLISLLCGNVNIIRLSQRTNEQLSILLEVLNELMIGEFSWVKNRLILLTYPHDDLITRAFSKRCNARVVWGGDSTVSNIRKIEMRPTAVEVCFPDRFSSCVIKSKGINDASDEELLDVAKKFYNDTVWFSQQACSSPRLLAWVGSADDCLLAKSRFWSVYDELLTAMDFENSGGMSMDRLVSYCLVASESESKLGSSLGSFPLRLEVTTKISDTIKGFHGGNGLFIEKVFTTLDDFISTLTDRDQTLAYFGFCNDELTLVTNKLPFDAGARFVQIGNALDFSPIWDGINLYAFYTRKFQISS